MHTGNEDIFLTKYSSDGSKIWTQQLYTLNTHESYGIVIDSSDNIYVNGYMTTLSENMCINDDIFLIKFDISGNMVWTKQLGTSKDEQSYGIAVDSSGYIYVTGYSEGLLDGNINAGDRDMFLLRTSPNPEHHGFPDEL